MCVYDCIGYVTGLFPTGGERTLVLTGHQRESETLLQLYASDDWKDVPQTGFWSCTFHTIFVLHCPQFLALIMLGKWAEWVVGFFLEAIAPP